MHSWKYETKPLEPGAWLGLTTTVSPPRVAGTYVEVLPQRCLRLTARDLPLLWARIEPDFYGYDVVRQVGRDVPQFLPPIRFRTVQDAPSRVAEPDRCDHYWAERFATWISESPYTPLHAGEWALGRPNRNTNSFDDAAVRLVVDQRAGGYVDWSVRMPYPFTLRDLSHEDSGRVKAWRKCARNGTLPPLLVWWVSGLQAHVILDGHDRVLAAALEERSVPALVLRRVIREKSEPTQVAAIEDAVAQLLATCNRGDNEYDAKVESVNRILLRAHAEFLVEAPTRARAAELSTNAWREEVAEVCQKTKVDSSMILAGL